MGEVVPEVVTYDSNGRDAQGVDYSRLTALLIEAVKEQQSEINNQQLQIARLTKKVGLLAAALRGEGQESWSYAPVKNGDDNADRAVTSH